MIWPPASRLKAVVHAQLACWERRGHDALVETPDTRYAKTDDGTYIAYQAAGEGPDLAWQLDYQNNVEDGWEDPVGSAWYPALARFSRLILHDRRGVGLSSRNVPPPNLETRVADLEVVLDTAGADRVVLGVSSNPAHPTSCSRLLIRSASDRSYGSSRWRAAPGSKTIPGATGPKK
jgi:pimeloyl-ACP methyl ester carboxylesterase